MPTDENVDPNIMKSSKEEPSAPKQQGSHWDVIPTWNAAPVAEPPKHFCWNQAAIIPGVPTYDPDYFERTGYHAREQAQLLPLHLAPALSLCYFPSSRLSAAANPCQ